MKKSLLVLLLLFPLMAFSQRDFKLVDQSQSQRPSWLTSGNNRDAFMVQANRMASLQDAQDAAMASLLENIASSVAVNVSGKTVQDVDWTIAGNNDAYNEKIQKTTVTEIADMPALQGISISKAQIYWEKYHNKKTKETYYDYYMLYPFSSYDLEKLINEYNEYLASLQYPSEWKRYTTDAYLYDIQGEKKNSYMSESEQTNRLLDIARANIAKQIQVKIEDNASSARVHSVPEVDVTMMETKSHFNSKSNKIFVIAFINKTEAHRFYKRQADVIFNNVEKHITITETCVETGFMSKAKEEIKKAEAEFKKLEQPIFFLTVFDCPDYELQEILQRYSELEQTVKRKISEMEYGTSIYVECVADMFGQSYFNLQKELKSKLSEDGCNFVDDKASADWAITIKASSRQYNTMDFGSSVNYFSYVDAEIAVEKVVTNQRIYEDMLTEKGGHTHNFTEAARDAYKKLTPKIIELVIENLK